MTTYEQALQEYYLALESLEKAIDRLERKSTDYDHALQRHLDEAKRQFEVRFQMRRTCLSNS